MISGALLDVRLEVFAFDVLELEAHATQWTIEMIFADVARDQSATFVDGPSKNRVTAHANTRTARRFLQ